MLMPSLCSLRSRSETSWGYRPATAEASTVRQDASHASDLDATPSADHRLAEDLLLETSAGLHRDVALRWASTRTDHHRVDISRHRRTVSSMGSSRHLKSSSTRRNTLRHRSSFTRHKGNSGRRRTTIRRYAPRHRMTHRATETPTSFRSSRRQRTTGLNTNSRNFRNKNACTKSRFSLCSASTGYSPRAQAMLPEHKLFQKITCLDEHVPRCRSVLAIVGILRSSVHLRCDAM